MTGKQIAVKLFKRPVDPEVAHQLVQGINIQCAPEMLKTGHQMARASGSACHTF